MKITISRLFESRIVLEALAKAKLGALNDFVTYLSDLAEQMIRALRNGLTFEDNLDCEVRSISLKHAVAQKVTIRKQNRRAKHVIPTRTIPSANPILSFAWSLDVEDRVVMQATFAGSPSDTVDVTVLILF